MMEERREEGVERGQVPFPFARPSQTKKHKPRLTLPNHHTLILQTTSHPYQPPPNPFVYTMVSSPPLIRTEWISSHRARAHPN